MVPFARRGFRMDDSQDQDAVEFPDSALAATGSEANRQAARRDSARHGRLRAEHLESEGRAHGLGVTRNGIHGSTVVGVGALLAAGVAGASWVAGDRSSHWLAVAVAVLLVVGFRSLRAAFRVERAQHDTSLDVVPRVAGDVATGPGVVTFVEPSGAMPGRLEIVGAPAALACALGRVQREAQCGRFPPSAVFGDVHPRLDTSSWALNMDEYMCLVGDAELLFARASGIHHDALEEFQRGNRWIWGVFRKEPAGLDVPASEGLTATEDSAIEAAVLALASRLSIGR